MDMGDLAVPGGEEVPHRLKLPWHGGAAEVKASDHGGSAQANSTDLIYHRPEAFSGEALIEEGARVVYHAAYGEQNATVVSVHYGDDSPYYTIRLDGQQDAGVAQRELQTVRDRITPMDPPVDQAVAV